jgi:hypothetical protein
VRQIEAKATAAAIEQCYSLVELLRLLPALDHHRPMAEAVIGQVRKARNRRARLLDLGADLPAFPAVDLGNDNVQRTANTIRDLIGVDVATQRRFRDAGAALRAWIHAAERLGVLVFQSSRVPTSEFLGLSNL